MRSCAATYNFCCCECIYICARASTSGTHSAGIYILYTYLNDAHARNCARNNNHEPCDFSRAQYKNINAFFSCFVHFSARRSTKMDGMYIINGFYMMLERFTAAIFLPHCFLFHVNFFVLFFPFFFLFAFGLFMFCAAHCCSSLGQHNSVYVTCNDQKKMDDAGLSSTEHIVHAHFCTLVWQYLVNSSLNNVRRPCQASVRQFWSLLRASIAPVWL